MAHPQILVLFLFLFVGALAAQADPQLSASDGACVFPPWNEILPLPDVLKALTLEDYFVPRASVSFYRTEFEVLSGGTPPNSLDQLAALLPRASFMSWQALMSGGNLKVMFDGVPGGWFEYTCLPGTVASLGSLTLLPSPLLNMTCSLMGGCSGSMSPTQLGPAYIAILAADDTSATLWGCFMGQQSWHIISSLPALEPAQVAANDALLSTYGFDMANAMNMTYPDSS